MHVSMKGSLTLVPAMCTHAFAIHNPTIITETYYVKYGDLLYSLSGPMCPCSGSGQLEIFWTYSESGNNHGGYIDLQWLRENTYSLAKFLEKGNPKKQTIAVSIDAFPW